MIILECSSIDKTNFNWKKKTNSILFRTPPPPPIVGDPLRVRLFPSDSDEEISDDHLDL